jgi:hypothetical protein
MVTVREIGRYLPPLPLIPRCIVVGAICTGMMAAVVTVINVMGDYPANDLVQAMLFGIIEAFVLGGVAGCVLGLVVGVLAYLTRSAMRGVTYWRS